MPSMLVFEGIQEHFDIGNESINREIVKLRGGDDLKYIDMESCILNVKKILYDIPPFPLN